MPQTVGYIFDSMWISVYILSNHALNPEHQWRPIDLPNSELNIELFEMRIVTQNAVHHTAQISTYIVKKISGDNTRTNINGQGTSPPPVGECPPSNFFRASATAVLM